MNIQISRLKLINGFKTAIACMIGYVLFLFSPLPQSQWIIITILVVMSAQTSIGSLFIKAKMRFLGTICGALAATLIILICGDNNLFIGIGLFIVFILFTYLASSPGDINTVGTLGSVTVAIILLNPVVNMAHVGERFIEINLGIIISFLVSYFIFPVRSHSIFIQNLISTLDYFRENFAACFLNSDNEEAKNLTDVSEKILSIFAQQRRLIQETALELGKSRLDKKVFQQVLHSERRIHRAIILIYYSLHSEHKSQDIIQDLEGFKDFKQDVSDYFTQLSEFLKTASVNKTKLSLSNPVIPMDQDFQKMPGQDYHDAANVHTFLFAAKLLVKELNALTQTISEINYIRIQKKL